LILRISLKRALQPAPYLVPVRSVTRPSGPRVWPPAGAKDSLRRARWLGYRRGCAARHSPPLAGVLPPNCDFTARPQLSASRRNRPLAIRLRLLLGSPRERWGRPDVALVAAERIAVDQGKRPAASTMLGVLWIRERACAGHSDREDVAPLRADHCSVAFLTPPCRREAGRTEFEPLTIRHLLAARPEVSPITAVRHPLHILWRHGRSKYDPSGSTVSGGRK
jgi:hypothetical protein